MRLCERECATLRTGKGSRCRVFLPRPHPRGGLTRCRLRQGRDKLVGMPPRKRKAAETSAPVVVELSSDDEPAADSRRRSRRKQVRAHAPRSVACVRPPLTHVRLDRTEHQPRADGSGSATEDASPSASPGVTTAGSARQTARSARSSCFSTTPWSNGTCASSSRSSCVSSGSPSGPTSSPLSSSSASASPCSAEAPLHATAAVATPPSQHTTHTSAHAHALTTVRPRPAGRQERRCANCSSSGSREWTCSPRRERSREGPRGAERANTDQLEISSRSARDQREISARSARDQREIGPR